MSVKVRLSRIGKTHAPMYRIVAIDSRKKRDGEALEILGTYNPLTGQLVQFHVDRINDWVSKGAIVTDSVKKLQKLYKKNPAVTGAGTAGSVSSKPVKAKKANEAPAKAASANASAAKAEAVAAPSEAASTEA